mgnify:FL=1
MIHYSISSSNPAAHYFDIELHIQKPHKNGQIIRLPAWIPGSYMIRDFAKDIVEIKAASNGKPLTLTQLDKSSWQLEPIDQKVVINYRVYAWDLSVRSAHLDTTHGFFNGSSVFLEVVGQGESPCTVEIIRPDNDACKQWRLATTLSRASSDEINFEFGLFTANNYEELIDHPVEMGCFTQFDYISGGIRHDVVLTGKFQCDVDRLKNDLEKICAQQINLFSETPPMTRYMFLVMVVGEGYGGLEHRESTSLLCSRNNLPQPGQIKLTEEYRSFLGLCSHEYFHSWNIKRIKPEVFTKPDLSTEVYTPLLWAFEGITSYYDDLALVRCGCITAKEYLELIGQTITRVQRGQGRLRQSAATSSFNAWSKFYKQDENSVNAIVSYYAKGSLIALCIDLKIRQLTANQHSLDDVMRQLWSNYESTGKGISDFEIQQIINDLLNDDVSEYLHQMIYGVDELPLAEALKYVSVNIDYRVNSGHQDKGGNSKEELPLSTIGINVAETNGGLNIVSVNENKSAQRAGLSADDVLIAINGVRATMKSYMGLLALSKPGTQHEFIVFRRDELMRFNVELDKPEQDTAVLNISDVNNPSLQHWLVNLAS